MTGEVEGSVNDPPGQLEGVVSDEEFSVKPVDEIEPAPIEAL